jgi:peptidoglycan hydrolase CwlO-like protein
MSDEKQQMGLFDALGKIASTLSPFISIAFVLIAYIYTTNQSDNQGKLNDIIKEQKEIKDAISDLKSSMIQGTSRMDRQGERIDEDRKRMTDIEQTQKDMEKTIILYNANRR